jgi:hypothetical protein
VPWESETCNLFLRRLQAARDQVPSDRRFEAMKGHSCWLTRSWMLLLGVVVLIAGHVIFFNHLRHAGLSLAVVLGPALLAIAKHLGLLDTPCSQFRRRSRH